MEDLRSLAFWAVFGWKSLGEPKTKDLMPGELLFVMPGERGFGDKVYVNVGKIIETSYLISGFSNTSSSENP